MSVVYDELNFRESELDLIVLGKEAISSPLDQGPFSKSVSYVWIVRIETYRVFV